MRRDYFEEYTKTFNKVHKTQRDQVVRHQHYHRALRYINSFNRQVSSYKLKINHLADWTEALPTSLLIISRLAYLNLCL